MQYIFTIIFLTLTTLLPSAHAQQIQLHFPAFAGKEWDLILLQGLQKDTVLQGTIPSDGRVVLKLPERRRAYSGMARWMLRDGGGLDFVLNGESFQVECLSDQPNDANIIYTGSKENAFLRDNYRQQAEVLAKYEVMAQAVQLYEAPSELRQHLVEEQKNLRRQYEALLEATAASPLYAARFHEIVNFTRGTVRSLDLDEYGRALEADRFIRAQMSWPALYTSNHWSGVVFSWMQLHAQVIQSDSLLLASVREVLGKRHSDQVYTDLSEQLVRYLLKFGKDSLLQVLTPEIRGSGQLLRYTGLLAQFNAVQVGEPAPALVGAEGTPLRWEAGGPPSVLLFYQSTCGPCSETLDQLRADAARLEARGVRLISVSSDGSEADFKSQVLPWRNALWEKEGLNGANHRAYGVLGTPTLLVIDGKGVIRSRTALYPKVKEVLGAMGYL